jgi:outer membrane protein, protease secretion system
MKYKTTSWLRKLPKILIISASILGNNTVCAIDLLDAYNLSLTNDLQLLIAQAKNESENEALPSALAKLLPNISASLSGGWIEQHQTSSAASIPRQNYTSENYSISVTQPIFRPKLVTEYQQANIEVLGSKFELDDAFHQVAPRISSLYFKTLFYQDTLNVTISHKNNLSIHLKAAKISFENGRGTKTEIHELQAQYDSLLAQEIKDLQKVTLALKELSLHVNQPIKRVSSIDPKKLNINEFDPGNLKDWIDKAIEKNPKLQSLNAKRDAATLMKSSLFADHLPSIDVVASYQHNTSNNSFFIDRTVDSKSVMLKMEVPIFQGGYVNSRQRAATAYKKQVKREFELNLNKLIIETYKQFHTIKEGIKSTHALEKALQSSIEVIYANKKSIQAGFRSTLDLLTAEEKYHQTSLELKNSQYLTLLAWINLSSLDDKSDEDKIRKINTLLYSKQ